MTFNPGIARRTFIGGSLLIAAQAGDVRSSEVLAMAAPSAVEPPWTGGGTVARAGGVISYRTIGAASAEPVVLLHKVGGWLADWRDVAPLLAARYRVIAIDLPGHGESVMLGAPPHVQTVSESAAVVLAVLSELQIERFAVAGNSLGGVIAVQMAARWPERVRALMLASVSLYEGQTRAELDKVEQDRDPAVWTEDWRPLPRTMEQVARFGTVNPAIETEQNASRARADRWVRPSERGVALTDTAALLGLTRLPVQLIYADRGYYTKYIKIGRAARPDATIVQLADAGSFVHQEKPAETAAAMLAFLEGLS
ncbi:alpha/beta fold hydrolase [Sphingomonas sp. 35-24ZXX]|uniref:alpha/beta fold hydrolase n=1 Tax=Sphingomonas sp. 35-24ZXX TaxID=1545915 RepID=UPI00068C51D3|nr:alpha/beta fold hydrolase [Sphingomonas sp. 35-24ZXX]